jgi:hypothetical protein
VQKNEEPPTTHGLHIPEESRLCQQLISVCEGWWPGHWRFSHSNGTLYRTMVMLRNNVSVVLYASAYLVKWMFCYEFAEKKCTNGQNVKMSQF